jgi:YidC/Oxa1 family membrane protein insertase
MKRMQKLQPKMLALREKLKNDREKMNREMMGLYKRYKVNPLGGCLPILLQLPIFFALYSALGSAIELRHAPFAGWLSDLSSMDGLFVLPLLMGGSMVFQQRMTPTTADPVQARIMQWMPVIFTLFMFTFPSGLTLYWLTSNILSIAQQVVINRVKVPEPVEQAG